MDKCWQNKPRYPLDSDLSGGLSVIHFLNYQGEFYSELKTVVIFNATIGMAIYLNNQKIDRYGAII